MVVGTESCGKSTLVRNLAQYYNTTYVEEKGRDICEFAGGIDNMIPSDFVEILYSHKNAEIHEQGKANKVLFIDTDCVITDYYLQLQFEDTDINYSKESDLASAISNLNKYDLILFLESDVPWVQDGTRTYGDKEVRMRNEQKLRKMLENEHQQYHSISGSYQNRFTGSVKLVDELMNLKEDLR